MYFQNETCALTPQQLLSCCVPIFGVTMRGSYVIMSIFALLDGHPVCQELSSYHCQLYGGNNARHRHELALQLEALQAGVNASLQAWKDVHAAPAQPSKAARTLSSSLPGQQQQELTAANARRSECPLILPDRFKDATVQQAWGLSHAVWSIRLSEAAASSILPPTTRAFVVKYLDASTPAARRQALHAVAVHQAWHSGGLAPEVVSLAGAGEGPDKVGTCYQASYLLPATGQPPTICYLLPPANLLPAICYLLPGWKVRRKGRSVCQLLPSIAEAQRGSSHRTLKPRAPSDERRNTGPLGVQGFEAEARECLHLRKPPKRLFQLHLAPGSGTRCQRSQAGTTNGTVASAEPPSHDCPRDVPRWCCAGPYRQTALGVLQYCPWGSTMGRYRDRHESHGGATTDARNVQLQGVAAVRLGCNAHAMQCACNAHAWWAHLRALTLAWPLAWPMA